MDAWETAALVGRLRSQINAIRRTLKRVSDPSYTPLSPNGVLLLERELTRLQGEIFRLQHPQQYPPKEVKP